MSRHAWWRPIRNIERIPAKAGACVATDSSHRPVARKCCTWCDEGMPMSRVWSRCGVVVWALALAGCVVTAPPDPHDNGIFVEAKVYNNKALQTQLLTLSSRLSQVSGIDQASLMSRIGALQGATSSQTSASFQALGAATPSV